MSSSRFHLPLCPEDTEESTLGCRHTNHEICGKWMLAGTCAFARTDGVCLSPPKSWPRQYLKLKGQQ